MADRIGAFSLTLTLSRWEREQPLVATKTMEAGSAERSRGIAQRRGAFLPLPAGEGRGEGESGALAQRLRFNLNGSKRPVCIVHDDDRLVLGMKLGHEVFDAFQQQFVSLFVK